MEFSNCEINRFDNELPLKNPVLSPNIDHAATINRYRAARTWMGEYSRKMPKEFGFPKDSMTRHQLISSQKEVEGGGDPKTTPWFGDLSNMEAIKTDLKCREYSWFIHKFREVYLDGGLVPEHTYMIRYLLLLLLLSFR